MPALDQIALRNAILDLVGQYLSTAYDNVPKGEIPAITAAIACMGAAAACVAVLRPANHAQVIDGLVETLPDLVAQRHREVRSGALDDEIARGRQ